ncbi:PBS lyase HEAT domain protein repeat-containing protein (plasmid) [Gloeothece citriformis PCC 7424]|uniref:PBS lyase HEAT domain protein repeat-containing protein n=1 Tax=Gloeothece citriformis (strain PCC 7424) TaxID=65393 RepID=B7KLX4_GLOC7|nr:HEAT repeat domain-containing protein [Gloeothece citriformis]ACK73796.1 PBS lyase HEAT domain protein repeat-containing protein [Gloeothece citriformis PCC 7424]
MDKRFFKLYNLTEEEAIAVLDTPQDQIEEDDSRYVVAAHLVNFQSENSINALIRAIQNTDPSLDNRIVRRKSIETLGRLHALQAIPVIRTCLAEEDCYTVEIAVWSLGEIGCQDPEILEEMAQLLDKPGQLYRVIIHTLAKLNYQKAIDRIKNYIDHKDKTIASAAISAICRLSGDYREMEKVVAFLQHPNVNARRGCIQDLIDCCYYPAIAQIASCPVSLVFRLRAIRTLAETGIKDGSLTFEQIQPSLEKVLRDHPDDLNLVHQYDQPPSIEFVIRELYHTDFGRCYLASKTLLDTYSQDAPQALLTTYAQEAHNDYGAHYHVIKLLGWLCHHAAYDLLIEALQNTAPQFQKSRAAAAIALGEIGDKRAIPALEASLKTPIWDLKYASLMALDKLGEIKSYEIAATDPDPLIRAKVAQTSPKALTAINP